MKEGSSYKRIINGIKWYFKEALKPEYYHYKAGNFWSMIIIPVFIIVWFLIILDKLIK